MNILAIQKEYINIIKGNFIYNLPKLYVISTGGFIFFIILLAIWELIVVGAKAIGIAFVAIA